MMIFKIALFLLTFFTFTANAYASLEQDPGEHLYPNMKKITDTFYKAEEIINGKHYYVCAERLTSANLHLYRNYFAVQGNETLNKMPLPSTMGIHQLQQGSIFAHHALREALSIDEEKWVIYVTDDPHSAGITADMQNYNVDHLMRILEKQQIGAEFNFANHIKMFVTATTSPDAFAVSPVGIAASIESFFLPDSPKDIAIDYVLANMARVMLKRNPDRLYMINAPMLMLEKKLAHKLPPASVFVGTKEMHARLKKLRDLTLEDFRTQQEKYISSNTYKMEHEIRRAYFYANEALHVQKITSEIEIKIAAIANGADKEAIEVLNFCAENLSKGWLKADSAKQKEYTIRKLYEEYRNPYIFGKINKVEEMLEFMEKYPPILSTDGFDAEYGDFYINQHFTIFAAPDSNVPVLDVYISNYMYDWLFRRRPYGPYEGGGTHYVVVDLKALANYSLKDPS